jgi:ABC-type multidrug transport system permease subunit
VAVFIGVVFLKLQNDIAGFQNRLGLIFFSLLLFAFACLSAVDLCMNLEIIFPFLENVLIFVSNSHRRSNNIQKRTR